MGLLGDPPNISQIPQEFWDRAKDCEQKLLTPFMAVGFAAGANLLNSALKMPKIETASAEAFASKRAEEVAISAVKRSRDGLQRQIEIAAASDSPISPEGVEGLFGRPRARATGRTEVAIANTGGEANTIGRIREGGDDVETIWRVDWPFQHATRHCPICIGLDKATEKKWVTMAPNGPPLHPQCCCFLDIVVNGKIVQTRFRR